VAWSFIRPADPEVLSGRPLLDIGTGDGQTLAALAPDGFGIDRDLTLLRRRPRVAVAEAEALPFRDGSFGCVLAGDLFHHLDPGGLETLAAEVFRVLRPEGRLVAWWYAEAGVRAPDAPRFPRGLEAVRAVVEAAGFRAAEIELVAELEAGPQTVGLAATR
jgi:SAM-dependent methyltransferase